MDAMKKMISRIEKCISLHAGIIEWGKGRSSDILDLANSSFFESVIESFGPCLPQQKARVNLKDVFDAAFHQKSGSLIIANKGVNIFCLSPFTSIPYVTRHIAACVYKPELGLEAVNIGIIGDIYSGDIIFRAESACPPSFLFGSQRCNCSYQWASLRELAAHFNPVNPPTNVSGEEFELWVQKQFACVNGKHIANEKGRGVILMHLDSQSGMGSGFTEKEFAFDLYSRALMRQLGENTTEQIHHTSIKEGYEMLGIPPDSRKEENEAGYQIPSILLNWLQASKHIVVLSNNRFKIKQLQLHGYEVTRVKSLGKIGSCGRREAKQRGEDFNHLDMDGEEISFEDEIKRLKMEFSNNTSFKLASLNDT